MHAFTRFAQFGLEMIAALLLLALLAGLLLALVLYVADRSQTADAVRRNFPVIGRFRSLFIHLGEFFRQYFFAFDRQELPFNRAERTWVEHASENVPTTQAFGSTRDLHREGAPFFINAPFPSLEGEYAQPSPLIIGPYCASPYTHAAFFNISAMSFGAISEPAVRALSRGAGRAGIWMDTGEGGLAPYHLEGGCDVVFEIGTAKYGVRTPEGKLDESKLKAIAAHREVRLVSVKLGQGAKPGQGGLLPGSKVTAEIARIRGIPEGRDSISPPRHADIGNVDELIDFIVHTRALTGKPVGFKAPLGDVRWLDVLCARIRERGEREAAPDFIIVDGAEGGTGAAPQTLMEGVGLPLREALPALVDTLLRHALRERIKVVASGKCITAYEVAWALAMGADFVNSARGFMFALGCIQSLQCNRNTCPTGITTHDVRLQRGLVVADKAERVARYAQRVMHEVGAIAHACGVDDPRALRRWHCRVVADDGRSVAMDSLYPYPPGTMPRNG